MCHSLDVVLLSSTACKINISFFDSFPESPCDPGIPSSNRLVPRACGAPPIQEGEGRPPVLMRRGASRIDCRSTGPARRSGRGSGWVLKTCSCKRIPFFPFHLRHMDWDLGDKAEILATQWMTVQQIEKAGELLNCLPEK